MRALALGFVVASVVACGATHKNRTDGMGSNNTGPDACAGLQCQVVNCEAMGMPPTTISGTVFAPNGTLPLYGINVYVPNSDPGPMPSGLTCNQCSATLPGDPVGKPVQTDEAGKFTLTDMPTGTNIPLVITTGKWRRIINISNVGMCNDTPTMTADTRLPKSIDDMTPNTKTCGAGPCVDMPKIAMTTGGCDVLECLARRLGIADKEFTNSSGTGHVHLYQGTQGAGAFDASFGNGQGGASFASATPMWGGNLPGTPATLTNYDIVMMSCECGQTPNTKPDAAIAAMKSYADMGGRVFASHWHNVWIGGGFASGGTPAANAVWAPIATWDAAAGDPGSPDLIDEVNNPKGPSFATWMLNVAGSTVRDQIVIQAGTDRSTATALDTTKAERWTYTGASPGLMSPQNFQFTTPQENSADNRCGKVVFSDMHVSGGPLGTTFPASCGATTTLTPQEKALAFMFFDIASCVSNIP